jgi:hypothetical protein
VLTLWCFPNAGEGFVLHCSCDELCALICALCINVHEAVLNSDFAMGKFAISDCGVGEFQGESLGKSVIIFILLPGSDQWCHDVLRILYIIAVLWGGRRIA